MVNDKKFKGHTIIKKGDFTIIRDEVEDIIIKGQLINIIPKKSMRKKKTVQRKPLILK